jgi:hypothetical protein
MQRTRANIGTKPNDGTPAIAKTKPKQHARAKLTAEPNDDTPAKQLT